MVVIIDMKITLIIASQEMVLINVVGAIPYCNANHI